jgi:hypothetical protein
MSDKIRVAGASSDNAILLLAAAQELDLPAHVVETTEGAFIVPAAVAEKAGFDEHGVAVNKGAKEAEKATLEAQANQTDWRNPGPEPAHQAGQPNEADQLADAAKGSDLAKKVAEQRQPTAKRATAKKAAASTPKD